MTLPLPFQVASNTGNRLAGGFAKARDENAIERILSESIQSNDPAVLQNNIGKILSQVSPERQGAAVKYLEGVMENVKSRQAAEQGGYTYGAPPAVQAQQVKDRNKQIRLEPFGLGNPLAGDISPTNPNQTNVQPPNLNQNPNQPQVQNKLENLSDAQLRILTGSQDKEISEPAKAILKNREDQANLNQKKEDRWTKFGMERAKKVLDRAEEIAQKLPVKKTALNLMRDAFANKDLGFWSLDNLAEITGNESFRSKEGAIVKTAGKEYFLGNIARAGARPNQWIEQQIGDMLPKIGRSTEANLSVERALRNETDLEEEYVRLTEEVYNDIRASEDKDIGDLGTIVNKRLLQYAEDKQRELFNDLRAIHSISEGKAQKYQKVKEGTKISQYMVDALLNTYNNDPDMASKKAKELGYSFE